MEITITGANGYVLWEIKIDEEEQFKQTGETVNDLASAITSYIGEKFEIKSKVSTPW